MFPFLIEPLIFIVCGVFCIFFVVVLFCFLALNHYSEISMLFRWIFSHGQFTVVTFYKLAYTLQCQHYNQL